MKAEKTAIGKVGILGGLISLPSIALFLLPIRTNSNLNSLLRSTFSWLSSTPYSYNSTIINLTLITIIAQWIVLTLVTLQLTRKIRKLGTSNSQKLLT
ncbi:MAG: hypothetical protein F6K17_41410 [Okeania sp. SIO3C4]|nr:hypothetical protein [Okeania sp. SIO3C4]